MSLGASLAGVDVLLAIEKDPHAAATYKFNHPNVQLIIDDIANVDKIDICKQGKTSILFGGPPCQGFSTSNQRTRNRENPSNWLFKEFVRLVALWEPDWVVFENVRGILRTENGLFLSSFLGELENINYTCTYGVLNASDFGVPQVRSRFFLVASRHEQSMSMPKPLTCRKVTVYEAIADLPTLFNGARFDYQPYSNASPSSYAKSMRHGKRECNGHLVTKNGSHVIARYKHVPQGGNWENIPEGLMRSYKNRSRCHTGIYRRLWQDKPSVVLGNYRKNMLIHPWIDRGLSVREAARLQSFPDSYEFQGLIGFQQQQVGNAVPPLLAQALFSALIN